jgi:hypothetical protein
LPHEVDGRADGGLGGLWYNPPNATRFGPIIPDNPNWHRSKGWCPYYRERWAIGQEADGQGGRLLYQIICLQNTPPETEPEQAECMKARSVCWRNQPKRATRKKAAASTA